MCGIAGIHVKRNHIGSDIPFENLVDGLLLGIEERGKDATGFVAVSEGGKNVTLEKDALQASYFVQLRNFLPESLRTVLLHTRLATQGDPKYNENNHPVVFNSCFVTHNGMIYNDYSLFNDVLEDVTRAASVDSIVIPTLVDRCGFGNVSEGLEKLMGSFAVAIIDPVNSPDELILARGDSSPLILLETRKFWMWASTKRAIENTYKWFYGTPPKDDRFREVAEGTIIKINADDTVEESTFSCPTRMSTSYSTGGRQYSPWARGRGRSYEEWEDDWEAGHYRWNNETKRYDPVFDATDTDAEACDIDDGILRDSEGVEYLCFECGDEFATTSVKDSHLKSNGNRVEWDYPVCLACRTEIGDRPVSETLSYRYARGVPMREVKKPFSFEEYRKKQEQNANTLPDNSGVIVRKGYTVEVLDIGDKIPEDYRDAFEPCEICLGTPEFIGKSGFAICADCRDWETRDEVNMAMKQLEAGDTQEGTTLISEVDDEYKKCDVCSVFQPVAQLTFTIFGYFCEGCALRGDEVNSIVDRLRSGEQGEWPELHHRTCKEVGWEMDISPGYVDWLLEHCDTARFRESERLHDQFKRAMSLYEKRYVQIETLARNGRDDLFAEVPLKLEAHKVIHELQEV